MVVITMMSYPPESQSEIVKRFMELPPLPEGITMKGHYINTEVGEGIKTIVIYEVDQTKFVDAMIAIGSRYLRYYGVPGFTYSIQAWLEIKEGLKMSGVA